MQGVQPRILEIVAVGAMATLVALSLVQINEVDRRLHQQLREIRAGSRRRAR